MSYPKNAATPKAVTVGSVILIADGTVQTAGCSVRVDLDGAGWGAGGGTLAYDATSGVVTYAPTQAETNGNVLMIAVYKASCIGCSTTVLMDLQSADNNTILANGTYGLSALKTHGDSDWATATGFSTHDAADVKTAIEAAGSHLTLILEHTGTTIPATITTAQGTLTKLDDTLENDGGTYRFTKNALEEAPSGTGGDATADNQTAILDAIAALDVGAGSGAIEHDVTVLDPDTDPISDVQVWVYTEEAMTNLVANGITDAFGVVTFFLDAGTYYTKCQKSGYNFDNPGTEVVTE